MEKTKLGISVALMGTLVCIAPLVGSSIPLIIIAGYILLRESDTWLKTTALKAVAIFFFFELLTIMIGFIPNILVWLENFIDLFDGIMDISIIRRIFNLIGSAITICERIFLSILAILALNKRSISVPFIDKIVKAHFSSSEEQE
ncbi:MAG: hypothetical protein K6B75_05120 [Lachnospiraceae bacterium]|nr:hypothetical protein [Lachnospiraceae bacterium]